MDRRSNHLMLNTLIMLTVTILIDVGTLLEQEPDDNLKAIGFAVRVAGSFLVLHRMNALVIKYVDNPNVDKDPEISD